MLCNKLSGIVCNGPLVRRAFLKNAFNLSNIRHSKVFIDTYQIESYLTYRLKNDENRILNLLHRSILTENYCTIANNFEVMLKEITTENYDKAIELLEQSSNYTTDQIFDIIRCAASKNNEILCKNALNLLPNEIRFDETIDKNLQKICTELVRVNFKRLAKDKLDPYQLIIQHLPLPEFSTEDYGRFLINEMILVNECASEILRICNKLIESKRNFHSIQMCLKCVTLSKGISVACDFIEILAKQQKLKPEHFQSIFVFIHTETELIEIIKYATQLKCTFGITQLLNWILPKMNKMSNVQGMANALIDAGIKWDILKTAMVAHFLNNNQLEKARAIANHSAVKIDPVFVQPALCNYIKGEGYKDSSRNTATLIKSLQTLCNDKEYDLAGQVILTVCDKIDQYSGFIKTKRLLHDFKHLDVKISRASANEILEMMNKRRNVPTALISVVNYLVCDKMFPQTQTDVSYKQSEIELLQQQLKENKEHGLPISDILFHLYESLIRYGKYDQALEMKKECEKYGVHKTLAMLCAHLKLSIATKNVDEALVILNTLHNKYPDNKFNSHRVIELATVLLTKNRIKDGMSIIEDLPEFSTQHENATLVNTYAYYLLNAACVYGVKNNCKENIAEQFLNILINKGYGEYSSKLLGTVIKEYLDKGQIHEAITNFERYANEYHQTPHCIRILTYLIKLSNDECYSIVDLSKTQIIEYIERINNLMTIVHGAKNANVNIIIAFAIAGNSKQLRKILMDPDVRYDAKKLQTNLMYIMEAESKIKAVINIAQSIQGVKHTHLNEQQLYEITLNDFVRAQDYASALQLFDAIKQSTASKVGYKFCKTLAEFLLNNQQPLPEHLKIYIQPIKNVNS